MPSALPTQGIAKAFAYINTIPAFFGYGVSGIVKNGTGDYTITWSTAFATSTYTVVAIAKFNAGTADARIVNIADSDFTTTTARVLITDVAGALADPNEFLVAAFEA